MTLATKWQKEQQQIAVDAIMSLWGRIEDALPVGVEMKEQRHGGLLGARVIHTTDGEYLGCVELDRSSYGYSAIQKMPNVYKVTSPRIPSRSKYDNSGTKRFTNFDNFLKAVDKYIQPKDDKEQELAALEKLRDNYNYRNNRQRYQWNDRDAGRAVRLLVDDKMLEANALLGDLKAQERRLRAYDRRVKAITDPLNQRIWLLRREVGDG